MKSCTTTSASTLVTITGRTITALSAAVAVAGAGIVAPPPPHEQAVRPAPTVGLAAATLPFAVGDQAPALVTAEPAGAVPLAGVRRIIIPPSVGQPPPDLPTIPPPQATPYEFEDAIVNTYHAIEPWVRYGFELATYAVGWVPWVGWLSPQIMIFYNFGERIVESLVVNSANWLWGPLPFGEGLANVARDSWDALVQLGRDEWNFWLPPLPPLPLAAEPADAQSPAPAPEKPRPVREALGRIFPRLAADAPRSVEKRRWADRTVDDADPPSVAAAPDPSTPSPDSTDAAEQPKTEKKKPRLTLRERREDAAASSNTRTSEKPNKRRLGSLRDRG